MKISKIIRKSLIIAAGACFAACSPSSGKIDQDIMDEQGVYENEKIEDIEMKIISVKEDADAFKSLAKIALLNISITEKKIKILSLDKVILREKEKLYTLLNKPKKRSEARRNAERFKGKSAYQVVKLEYLKAKLEDLKNLVMLKELELDLKIARRFLEKAKMAQAFKKEGPPGQSSQINISRYELSCREKEQVFIKYKRKRKKTAAILKKTESKFRPVLKNDECESVRKLLEN